ncbi:hypothetical protein D3C76_909630 [compost metagenome]|uniref:Uncharacterized protein n=1 Tax=Clostridium intestinale DSM 6191 TaxID=1121320 RepID=A0A1M5WX74_9CLOT|nr:transcriptional regulator [Clostridium intestinale]SHH92147.1 conserved hypothetical protein (putative transposase or invertase) [Clostridium intestinale DSM 6191]
MAAKGITYQAKDVLFKSMSSIYKDKALNVYGLNYPKIVEMIPSDLPEVKADEKRADSIFLLEDGSILLLEYESNKRVEENMFKYLDYTVRILRRYFEETKDFPRIHIAVVYTAEVKEAKSTVTFGDIIINSQSVFMSNFDGDSIFEEVKKRIQNKEKLTSEDKMKIVLLPLMNTSRHKQNIIEESIELVKFIDSEEEQLALIAGILTATDKFIEKNYAKKVREWLTMTKVDKIYQEEKEKAIEEAKKEVRRKEKLELAKNLMDVLSVEMIAKKTGLSIEEVEKLRESK